MGSHKDELENLLSEALVQHSRTRSEKRAGAGSMYVPQHQRARWTDPANWVLTGQVQLVHRESIRDGVVQNPSLVVAQPVITLVGLFDEFNHTSGNGARKLIATQRLDVKPPRIEYVTGDSWLGATILETKRKTPDRKVQVVEDIILDMGVSAPAVVLEIALVGGGISRASLTEATRFEGFTPRTVLLLPQGMDILEGLTRGTKERLWAETKRVLGIEDDEG